MHLIKRTIAVNILGNITLIASDRGLVAISVHAWRDQPSFSHRREAVVDGDHMVFGAAQAQLNSYVAGVQREFYLVCDLTGLAPFSRSVLETLRKVPWGQTRTYGQLAEAAGQGAIAARAVGQTMGRNPLPIVIPCHRVLASDGLGGFAGGTAAKRQLLALEGMALGSVDCAANF